MSQASKYESWHNSSLCFSSNSNPSLFMNDFLITTDNTLFIKYIALSVAMKFPQYFLQALQSFRKHVFNMLHAITCNIFCILYCYYYWVVDMASGVN